MCFGILILGTRLCWPPPAAAAAAMYACFFFFPWAFFRTVACPNFDTASSCSTVHACRRVRAAAAGLVPHASKELAEILLHRSGG